MKRDMILEMIKAGKSNEVIRDALGVTFAYIYQLRRSSGLTPCGHKDTWTMEEEDTLRQVYPALCPNELVLLFPNRSINGIKYKAKKMGLEKSEDYINHKKRMFMELSRERSVSAVYIKKGVREEVRYVSGKEKTDRRHLDTMSKECGWGEHWETLGNYGRERAEA